MNNTEILLTAALIFGAGSIFLMDYLGNALARFVFGRVTSRRPR